MADKFWKIRNFDIKLQKELGAALKIHPIVAQLLINRGVSTSTEADCFLSAEMSNLADPFLLKDMDLAVKRIKLAQERKERVLIFGDYDVDGITSMAILYKALKSMGLDVINHIPHRMHDGYGLNENICEIVKDKEINLLITVDCGITACREVDMLNQLGIDVVIIDHHETSSEGLPKAKAIINPKRPDCSYSFKDFAAVGLVAKLIQALFTKIQEEDLDLITLGTIADVVPLRGENRIFVKAGLPKMGQTKNKGLAALMEITKIKGKKFRSSYAGFVLGPRLNATGRMDSAEKSLDLLLSQDTQEAYAMAQYLDDVNSERQKLQRKIMQDAINIVEQEVNFEEHKVIVLSKKGWHKGVLGIVASRIADMYYRPTVVISLEEDGVGTASARSISGFHLNEALTHCSEILENFGGHKLAAGLTIREENINKFRDLINNFAKDILQIRELIPTLNVDYEIPLSSLSLDLVKAIDLLEPYGEGNPEPVFCSRGLTVKTQPVVLARETLKFSVTDGQSTISAIGFGMGKYKEMLCQGQEVDLAYQLSIDDWNKAPVVQLRLKDIKIEK